MKKTYTEVLLENGGIVNNSFEGTFKKVLFVCSAGILRSATAARMYGHKYNTRAAGTMIEHALVPLSEKLLTWADEIVFVHISNYAQATQYFHKSFFENKPVKVLKIPDNFTHYDEELRKHFEEQYEKL